MRRIQVLGMELTDYSVHEALVKTERFLKSGRLNLILYLSSDFLTSTVVSDEDRALVEQADLTLYSDLNASLKAGITDKYRISEIENSNYIREFLHRIAKEGYKVLLLAGDEDNLADLRTQLLIAQDKLFISGTKVVTTDSNVPALMNEINSINPDVIISRLDLETKRIVLPDTGRFLNAEVWLELNSRVKIAGTSKSGLRKKISYAWYRMLVRIRTGKA